MSGQRIGIIGGGNVGYAMAMGLAKAGRASEVAICDRNLAKTRRIAIDSGVKILTNDADVATQADILFLAVRGEQVSESLARIRPALRQNTAVVCLSAGVQIADLNRLTGAENAPIYRAVTNVNAAVGLAVTVLLAPKSVDATFDRVHSALGLVGSVMTVRSERQLDELSVMTGCGPALACILLEALSDFGREIGLDSPEASHLADLTVSSTVTAVSGLSSEPKDYRMRVATVGGVVERELRPSVSREMKEQTLNILRRIATGVTD